MYRILIVEDDFALAGEMKKQIESYGNEACCAENFRDITGEFRACAPHLVLMDIKLPYQDGYYWTAELRRISTVPIVFVSSASDTMNIVMAVSMGGDDFIAKPAEPMVLHAKLQAVLRRSYELAERANCLPFAGGELNLDDGTVRCGGRQAELTRNERRILQTLLENKGRIVSRDTLMLRLWNDDCFVEENTLTVNVNRLRKKLEDCGMAGVIVTKPGSGYLIS